MSKEAMKLALEALDGWGKGFPDNWGDLDTEAITALREALAEQPAQQQETINGRTVKVDWKAQALELRELVRLGGIKIAELEAELAEQPAQQEPWGACVYGRVFVGRLPEHARKFSEDEGVPIQWLYTSPPAQRTWVGLSDEEIRHINRSTMSLPIEEVLNSFARAIEAKLKEKNT